MLPAPRIIAIDDNPQHLAGLVKALNDTGVGCLSFQFTGDEERIKACPHVRIIFADLHLNESAASTDDAKHFSVIGGLIQENIAPTGLYCVILWTRFPDKAGELRQFLEQRLTGVPIPIAVVPLDKMNYLQGDGSVGNLDQLVVTIQQIVSNQPQLVALLHWEEKILGAAAATVRSVLDLIPLTPDNFDQRPGELGKLLARLGVEAVGQSHVEEDRFHAINEALLPILGDRIGNIATVGADKEVWSNVFTADDLKAPLSQQTAAKLNRFLHFDSSAGLSPLARGSVTNLNPVIPADKFGDALGLAHDLIATNEFKVRSYATSPEKCRWVIVQVQASCDFAQSKPGSLPLYLGIDLPAETPPKDLPKSVWCSPEYDSGEVRQLRISARFPLSFPAVAFSKATALYRLRDQLLNDLIYSIHSYAARPGITSFHETKDTTAKPVPAKTDGK